MDLLTLTEPRKSMRIGKLTSEFWYRLKAHHSLTRNSGWEIRINFRLDDGYKVVHSFKQFMVASAKESTN